MKKLSRILIFAALIIFLLNDMTGQISGRFDKDKCPQEKITVHLSQQSCFTGEILWFKIYCTSPVFPQTEISCLGFVELVSSENAAVIRKKIDIIHGEGSGEFEIPADLTTGLYKIIAYTSWMKNYGEQSFFRMEVLIVNPHQPLKSTNDSLKSGKLLKKLRADIDDTGKIRVYTDKKKYSSRGKVIVKIDQGTTSVKNLSGSFSVSVCRKEPTLKYFLNQRTEQAKPEDSVSRLYLPDHNGIVLSGILSDQSGNGVGNALLVRSLPGPGTDIDSYVTGSEGEFNFLLKRGEGEEDIVITLPGSDQKISLAEPFWNGFRNPPKNFMVVFDSEAVAYFRQKFGCFELQKRFNKPNFVRRVPVKHIPDSSVFYTKPFQTINLGSYITLDSLGEYFHELVPSVRFTRKRGEYDILVMDLKSMTYLNEKSAVFLDGVLFDDYSVIASYPPSELNRITVLPETYYYKGMSFGGIIDIHTKKSDFNGVKTSGNLTRFIYPKAVPGEYRYLSPDYSITHLVDRTPDLRYLLDWEPYLRVDSMGVAVVELYSGDVKGRFDVKVIGLTDKGEILSAGCEFLVE